MDVLLKEDEVETLETKLRDPTTGIIPKLSGDDCIKASDVVDWLVQNMPVSRTKACEYGQMLWNRGVFDHIAPRPFSDDDQLFRLKQSEISQRKSVDEQQWSQLKQDAAQKDTSSADPIAKLHKSIENATKVYQRLLREKNQVAPANVSLGLKLLNQTLNLITQGGSNTTLANYNQILNLISNPNASVDEDEENGFTPQPYLKKLPAIPESLKHQHDDLDADNVEVEDVLSVSESLEIGLIEQLQLVQQQTALLKLLQTSNNNNNNNNSNSLGVNNNKQIVSSPNILSAPYPNGFDESPISLQRQRSLSSVGSFKGIDLAPVVIGSVENKFPKFLIAEPKNDSFIFTINGPSSDQLESSVHACFNNNFFARTVSTYPHLPGHPKREGDPICDHFCVQMQSTRVIAAIADGCNWGVRPAEAALKASTTFVEFINKALSSEIQTVQDAGNHILSAFNFAHNKIIEGKSDIWEAGTTTLLGGVMVELLGVDPPTNSNNNNHHHHNNHVSNNTGASPSLNASPTASNSSTSTSPTSPSPLLPSTTTPHVPSPLPLSPSASPPSASPLSPSVAPNTNSNLLTRSLPNANILSKDKRDLSSASTPPSKWGFICASVGDCKAFHYNHTNKKFTDITKNNRGNVDDPKDPGGRLGPYVANGHPDLRNLCLHFLPCQENDIIILMSDGVHDNLDPQTIGVSPRECSLPHDSWSDMEFEKVQDNKSKYMQEFLKKKLRPDGDDPLVPKMIVERLVEHCIETTRSSRDFMVTFPNKPLPDDLKLYPGKMDHTTCIAFKVGRQSL